MNNLIWPDPYGDGHTLVGDAAETWQLSEGGKVVTFSLHKGVKFHDGVVLTAKDVAYNIERAWHPRSPTMVAFQSRVQSIQKVEALDDLMVRVTLAHPSNSLIQVMAMNQFAMYPSHLPFPEKSSEFRRQPIGSGPFKVTKIEEGIRFEYVRNPEYWKTWLPYLDGIVSTVMSDELTVAAWRTGRTDASAFQAGPLVPSFVKVMERQVPGFTALPVSIGLGHLVLNKRPPWTDQRVRQAVSLALDRPALVSLWMDGAGSPFSSPMLSPELGGQWGLSIEEMKGRPGFRPNKTEDLARAKQLLLEARITPREITVNILGTPVWSTYGQVVDSALRELGFNTKLDLVPTPVQTDRLRKGDFDINLASASLSFDDPFDYLVPWVHTSGGFNWGKWSNPDLDQLLDQQDLVLDVAKRAQMLRQVQEIILGDPFGGMILGISRETNEAYMPWVKNYPPRLPYQHSPRFRWEQVWLQR